MNSYLRGNNLSKHWNNSAELGAANLLILLLLLISTHSGNAQELYGSFGTASRFYVKCAPFEGEKLTEISEIAWKGERISKPFLIWTDHDSVDGVSFDISDFTSSRSTISSTNARLRSVKYARADHESKPCQGYKNREPANYLELGDILTLSLDSVVHPGCPAIYWLSVDIPRTSESGIYNGNINVIASGEIKMVFTINIQVVEYELPNSADWNFHLDLWQFPTTVADRYNDNHTSNRIEYWSDEHFEILKRKYQLLADIGQKVITAHIKEDALGSPSMINWIRKSNDNWEYDYTSFDKYVDSLINWGISEQISCQSPIGWNSDVIPYWSESENSRMKLSAPVGSDIYAKRWNHFLTDFKLHLDSKGWFKKAVLYLDEVEPGKLSWVIKLIKDNHPEWRIGIAGFNTPSDFVDSNVYDMSLIVGIEGNSSRNISEYRSTFYTSCNPPRPNNFVVGDAWLAENIWVGWHAQHMNYNGFLRWAFDNWVNNNPVEMRMGNYTSGDFALSYRSSNNLDMEICSSVRLELIREGIEDFEKVSILKERLKDSDDSHNMVAYNLLLRKIDEFTASSGESAKIDELVESAQDFLKLLARKQF
jgi:hypothetical protein